MNARPWGIPRFLIRQLAAGQTFRYDGHAFVNSTPSPFLCVFLDAPASPVEWTNQPSALTVFDGDSNYYKFLDLSQCTQVRLWLHLSVPGVAGSEVLLRYSTDFAAWTTITGTETTLANTIGHDSGWQTLPVAARVDGIFVQPWGQDGNGSADPAFRQIYAEFR